MGCIVEYVVFSIALESLPFTRTSPFFLIRIRYIYILFAKEYYSGPKLEIEDPHKKCLPINASLLNIEKKDQ